MRGSTERSEKRVFSGSALGGGRGEGVEGSGVSIVKGVVYKGAV